MPTAAHLKTVEQLSALAQSTRLAVFNLLIESGPGGVAAGEIAARVGVAKNTLSSHLSIMQHAGLIDGRREGRNLIYSVRIDTVADLIRALVQDCCAGHPEVCGPLRAIGAGD